MSKELLIEYIRDSKKNPIGVVVANGASKIGWSLCNIKSGDKFNKEIALTIAIARANTIKLLDSDNRIKYYENNIPRSILNNIFKMVIRSNKYFK